MVLYYGICSKLIQRVMNYQSNKIQFMTSKAERVKYGMKRKKQIQLKNNNKKSKGKGKPYNVQTNVKHKVQ